MEIAKYILIFFIWLGGLFTIGHIICAILLLRLKPTFFELFFRNILLGYIIVITVQSVWDTGFQTVNIVFVAILAFSWLELRKKEMPKTTSDQSFFKLQYIVPIVVGALLLFIGNWAIIRDSNGYLGFFVNQPDYIFYSKLSAHISSSGIENAFNILGKLDPYYSDPQPYHYFDVWGAAAVSSVFGINQYLSLMLIVYPTFYLLCFVAYISIFDKVNLITYCSAFLLLFVGGVYLSFLDSNSFMRSLQNISFNLLTPSIYKLGYFYVFLLAVFISFKRGEVILALLSLLCLPVANIITLPTVVPAAFITLCVVWWFKKMDKNIAVRSLLYIVLVSMLIVGFYALSKSQSAGEAGDEVSTSLQLLNDIFQQNSLLTMINIVVGGILSVLILYLPVILVLLANKAYWKQSMQLALFCFLVIIISLAVYALLYIDFNAAQIFYNISIPIINVGLSLLIVAIINRYFLSDNLNRIQVYATSFVLVCFTMYNVVEHFNKQSNLRHRSHDSAYLSKVDELLKPNALIASLKGSEDMVDLYAKSNAVYTLGDYLFLYNKNAYTVNIGDLSTPIDSSSYMNLARNMKAVKEGMFYRYSKLRENRSLSEASLIENFLNKFRIRYIIVSRNAELPVRISDKIETVVSDPISGEKFIVLRQN